MERITADDSGKYVVSVENDLGADCNYASVAVEGTSVCRRFLAFKGPHVTGTGTGIGIGERAGLRGAQKHIEHTRAA